MHLINEKFCLPEPGPLRAGTIQGNIKQNLLTCVGGRDSRKLSNLPKWPKSYLKYHLQLNSKEDIGNGGLGLQRGRETIHMEVEMQRFDKQMFAGPCRNNETQSEHSSLVCCIQLFATPWTMACQAPLSMEFFRQKYCSGLPFPKGRPRVCSTTTSHILCRSLW